jgi:hypothetical protein
MRLHEPDERKRTDEWMNEWMDGRNESCFEKECETVHKPCHGRVYSALGYDLLLAIHA